MLDATQIAIDLMGKDPEMLEDIRKASTQYGDGAKVFVKTALKATIPNGLAGKVDMDRLVDALFEKEATND